MKRRVLVSWSSGKDSAWALHALRAEPHTEVVGLLTAFNASGVSVHAVPRALVEAQARASGLPLYAFDLPSPCPNDAYEAAFRAAIARVPGITHVAFGDLFLEDIRAYRIRLLTGTGIEPLFPIWTTPRDTAALARRMTAGGLRATLVCVDTTQLDARYAGRSYDAALLAELPPTVDACGENGEFHTFCHDGPMYSHPIPVHATPGAAGGRFAYASVSAAEA